MREGTSGSAGGDGGGALVRLRWCLALSAWDSVFLLLRPVRGASVSPCSLNEQCAGLTIQQFLVLLL